MGSVGGFDVKLFGGCVLNRFGGRWKFRRHRRNFPSPLVLAN